MRFEECVFIKVPQLDPFGEVAAVEAVEEMGA